MVQSLCKCFWLRASSFIKTVPQISTKPIAFQQNLPRKLLRNHLFFANHFFSEIGLKNSQEIDPFFHEFVPENPTKFGFFFRDLPEALYLI